MKHLLLSTFLCGAFFFTSSSIHAQSFEGERNTVVYELDILDGERTMSIYSHFNSVDGFKVINTCEALGLVVLEGNLPLASTRSRAGQELAALGLTDAVILENKTPTEVMVECRQRMQELLVPEGTD